MSFDKNLRAAAMLLLALMLTASLSLLSPTLRAAAHAFIRRWTQTDYSDHLEITFPRVKGEGPLGVWVLETPPAGYAKSRGQTDEEHGWIEYINADGQWLEFSYRLMDEGTQISLNNENVICSELEVMGCRAILQESTKDSVSSGLMWFDEDIGVVFNLSGFMSGQELIVLAQNIQRIS